MTVWFRVAASFFALAILSGCAAETQSGLGIKGSRMTSVEPARAIGGGPLTPDSLLGVETSALSARLGPPNFKRAEPDAEVWQYGGAGCSLFVYFYKTDGGTLASTYVDARKAEGGTASPTACLADVVSKRSTPVS